MPLRSEPEEAAVAEVLGTLPVVVAVIFTVSSVDLELLGHHLRDLDVEPLPHLGAAVVQMDRAVGIDVHQRAGLVEWVAVKEMPNLTGVSAMPALEDRGCSR